MDSNTWPGGGVTGGSKGVVSMTGRWARQFNPLSRVTRQRWAWHPGNRVELLVDGESYFPAMFAAIDQARSRVLLEFYLVASGKVMTRLSEHLIAARQRGVDIWLLLDDFGSRGLGAAEQQRLHEAGINIARYNPLHLFKWDLNFARDHRKLLAIDGNIAFVGGTGLSDEFIASESGEPGWHELMLQVSGPVVADWERLFCRVWRWCSGSAPVFHQLKLQYRPEPVEPGALMKVSTCEGPQQQEIKVNFRRRIHQAEQRVWLVTAYFLPTWSIRRALRRAARRGIDVRLLLPGRLSDHPGIFYASRRYYQRLLRAGVRIYEYQPCFNHSKVCVCDHWVSLGSCNLDHWNLRWNLEANQELIDPQLNAELERVLREDFANANELTLGGWLSRPLRSRLYEFCLGYLSAIALRVFR